MAFFLVVSACWVVCWAKSDEADRRRIIIMAGKERRKILRRVVFFINWVQVVA